MSRWGIWLAALLLSFAPSARAAVVLTFYSHAMGGSFPHAFIGLHGTRDADRRPIDNNYGFTAVSVTPALLAGSVRGMVEDTAGSYVRHSQAHFSVVLGDAELANVLAAVQRWRDAPQNSYNLDRANCIHFVADVARTLGMEAEVTRNLRRRPQAFLDWLQRRNTTWLAARSHVGTAITAVR